MFAAFAQGGNGAPKSEKLVAVALDTRPQPAGVATETEIRIIREYYVAKGLRPKPLPPGIAKNLARGRKVPPGLLRMRVPDDLVAKLPPRAGMQWSVAGNVVLLVDGSNVVRDILREMF
jgi:hypothetical protein